MPTGTETLVISKSLSVEGFPAVVALCCGPRDMNLAFVIDQASPVGGCESAIGMVTDQPGRGSGKLCLALFDFDMKFFCIFFICSLRVMEGIIMTKINVMYIP